MKDFICGTAHCLSVILFILVVVSVIIIITIVCFSKGGSVSYRLFGGKGDV